MRNIILNLAVSLDGFIEGPNGEMDWLARDEKTDFGDILAGILEDIDVIFYGRVSYEKWGNYYPDETASRKLKNAYQLLHSKQKYVFSGTKTTGNKAIFINENIPKKVHEIKQQTGNNIWLYGGAKLTATFVNLGLIDMYRLAVHPIIIGSGKPLFEDIKRRVGLRLSSIRTAESGVVLLTYAADKKHNLL